MKIRLLLLSFVSTAFFACNSGSGSGSVGSGTADLNAEIDSVSYALGADIGSKLKQGGIDELNFEAFKSAMLTSMAEDSLEISLNDGMQKIQKYFEKQYKVKADANLKEGEEFLAKNKSEEGVKVTESGIQYIVIKEGNGPIPADTNQVKVHYHGTLIDGTVFDSSIDRGEPAKFPVKGVIKGWQEILQIMPVGSKWKVFIPAALAYGEQVRRGGPIGPNMALIFEMELLDIVDPVKEKAEMERKRKEQEELRKQQQNNQQ